MNMYIKNGLLRQKFLREIQKYHPISFTEKNTKFDFPTIIRLQ